MTVKLFVNHMNQEPNIFKNVDSERDRKLRYEGFCYTCNKIRPHRYGGSNRNGHYFRCMKCSSNNIGEHEKEK